MTAGSVDTLRMADRNCTIDDREHITARCIRKTRDES